MLFPMAKLLNVLAIGALVMACSPRSSPNAQEAGGQRQQSAREETGGGMRCPMMAGLSGIRLFADGPAAILARAEELGLDAQQAERLGRIAESARRQAGEVLTDDQRRRLGDVPRERIPVMKLGKMRMKGRMAGENAGGMCPMCMKMMKSKMTQAEEGEADRKGF